MQMSMNLEQIEEKKVLKRSGYFKYTDHYSYDPDNIFISTITSNNKTRLRVTTGDGIFTRGDYLFNDKEIKMLLNMIALAWQNHSNTFSCSFDSHKKNVVVKTQASSVKMERNKHMNIRINDKTIIYGLDINDSRRLWRLLRDLLNHKQSDMLI